MDAESSVYDLVVSRDGKWVVAGTSRGQVVVLESTSFDKANDFKAHEPAYTMDVWEENLGRVQCLVVSHGRT